MGTSAMSVARRMVGSGPATTLNMTEGMLSIQASRGTLAVKYFTLLDVPTNVTKILQNRMERAISAVTIVLRTDRLQAFISKPCQIVSLRIPICRDKKLVGLSCVTSACAVWASVRVSNSTKTVPFPCKCDCCAFGLLATSVRDRETPSNVINCVDFFADQRFQLEEEIVRYVSEQNRALRNPTRVPRRQQTRLSDLGSVYHFSCDKEHDKGFQQPQSASASLFRRLGYTLKNAHAMSACAKYRVGLCTLPNDNMSKLDSPPPPVVLTGKRWAR